MAELIACAQKEAAPRKKREKNVRVDFALPAKDPGQLAAAYWKE